jgi:hypothetical protein
MLIWLGKKNYYLQPIRNQYRKHKCFGFNQMACILLLKKYRPRDDKKGDQNGF